MIHIKTPVRVTLYGNIADSANELAFEARGPNFANLSKEAVPAINAYDDLVAQRDDLIAQRDALVEAVHTARRALEHSVPDDCWATGPLTGDVIQDLVVCPGCAAIAAIDAALAVAKGEQ